MRIAHMDGSPGNLLTSLVFAAGNPGRRVEGTWAEVRRFLAAAPGTWEVIFVCAGCSDGTPERLAALTRTEAARVRVFSHAPGQGAGHALRSGLQAARGTWRLFAEFDLPYGMEAVLSVARSLWAGAEVAVASRAHPESRLLVPVRLQGAAYRRHLLNTTVNTLARLLLPLMPSDSQAGLMGLNARAAWLVLPHLRCTGPGFACEMLTACAQYGLPLTEVAVQERYEQGTRTLGLRGLAQLLPELWQIRQAWRTPPPARAIPVETGRRMAA